LGASVATATSCVVGTRRLGNALQTAINKQRSGDSNFNTLDEHLSVHDRCH